MYATLILDKGEIMSSNTELLLNTLIEIENTTNIMAEVLKESVILRDVYFHDTYTKPSTSERIMAESFESMRFYVSDNENPSDNEICDLVDMGQEKRILAYISGTYVEVTRGVINAWRINLGDLHRILGTEQERLEHIRTLMGFTKMRVCDDQ